MGNGLSILQKLKNDSTCLALANEHHLSGLLYYRFQNIFSQNDTEVLRTRWSEQWLHNSVMQQEVIKFGHEFAKNKLTSVTLLKGVALFEVIYEDLGSRFISDCDLMIDQTEINQVEAILINSGYEKIHSDRWKANNFKMEFTKIVNGTQLNFELHTRLFYHTEDQHFKFVKSLHTGFRLLDKEDMVLHLVGHLAFQHTFLKLYWLFDLYFLLEQWRSALDWEAISVKSRALKIEKSLLYTIGFLKKYFDLSLERPLISNRLFDEQFLLYPMENKVKYYLAKHLVKDDLSESLKYDFLWLIHQVTQFRKTRERVND